MKWDESLEISNLPLVNSSIGNFGARVDKALPVDSLRGKVRKYSWDVFLIERR